MLDWKSALLSVYYYGSYPQRAWRNARWRAQGRAPIIVLFYHRVADDLSTPWTASNRMFERQIHWLKRNFDMVSLAEAQGRMIAGYNDRPCVAITFDDGYADNCRFALPLLIEQHIACTYFVSTQHVLEGVPFPHDAELGQPLAANTPDELRALAAQGIEIGAHTRTHADLGVADEKAMFDELVLARRELQAIVGSPIRYFAFPYGQHENLNPVAFLLARSAGYEGVCSAYGGFNFPGDDPFHLQRIHADNDMIRLKNWTSLDPRKLRSVRRYDYRAALEDSGIQTCEART